MIDPLQLLNHIIRPVLHDLDLWSPEAERLVLGTACKESECGRWLVQLGGGPALGIYQMEPATHSDLWAHYIYGRDALRLRLQKFCSQAEPPANELIWNLAYATAMCRIHYYRAPEKIPDDLPGQAQLWKLRYNTPLGAGTVDEYIAAWRQFVPAGLV